MKLQEKFEQAPEVYNANFEIVKGYEKIADEFAIGFAYWCEWRNDRAFKTYEELLEIYKEEKGL